MKEVEAAKEKGASANEVALALKESNSELFQKFLKKWDQASQMRKWISGMKLTTSERIEKEEDRKFRDEYAEAHPSEDALSGPLSDEQKEKVQEKVDARFDQECDEAFSNIVEKAKILIKLSIPEVLVERARIARQRTIQKSLSFKLREKLN